MDPTCLDEVKPPIVFQFQAVGVADPYPTTPLSWVVSVLVFGLERL